ncbi:MAG: hypothetical protein IPM42_15790 [Saprospiraceae bacterium]|nr:hypothetical protein [Saprospiraceae bacterium]
MTDKNSIVIGLALGAITPVLGFVVIEFIFNTLTDMGIMAEVGAGVGSRRFRTMLLIAICCNLIPFNIAKRNKWDDTLRGIVFPTLVYVGAWIFKFYGDLF